MGKRQVLTSLAFSALPGCRKDKDRHLEQPNLTQLLVSTWSKSSKFSQEIMTILVKRLQQEQALRKKQNPYIFKW
jgi:hypothetical protein